MRTSVALVIPLAVAAGWTIGCDRQGTRQLATNDAAGALNVPYPVAEPERIEGAGRKALANARFVLISLGAAPEDRDHALPERIQSDAPVLITEHLDLMGSTGMTAMRLHKLAFGRVAPTPGRAIEVPPEEVEALGLAPPAQMVWLVGPHGMCRAAMDVPVVAQYEGFDGTVVLGYRLDSCPGTAWAQIGIVSDSIPIDFRWVPAHAGPEHAAPYGRTWDEPLAAVIEAPTWQHADDPRFVRAWVREIPEVDPRVVQVNHALLSSVPEQDARDWCELDVAWSRADGWFNGRWIDAVPWHRDAVGPFMLGAFVNGTQVDAVIYDDRLDGLVVVPPGPLDDVEDPEAWTQVFVPTGPHDPVALDAWGVQPARGTLPVGPDCRAPDG